MIYQAPRGTYDILPEEIYKWHYLEKIILKNVGLFNYKELRFPIFEKLGLFKRSVGESTDIVEKEMYTFTDKKKRVLALRPEGTASIARAYVEHNMNASEKEPQRIYYFGPMFRYARPQKGRYRQFYQFGIENIGTKKAIADAEIIKIGWNILNDAKVRDVILEINSIGCVNCRKEYNKKLKKFLMKNSSTFCDDCQRRMLLNPLRVFDCKNKNCRKQLQEAPLILDNLCDECREHFKEVQEYLIKMNVSFNINPMIVRGLDYYTKTAFEYKVNYLGAQDALGGGGRYDGLIQYVGGKSTPAVGFSMGMGRIILALERSDFKISREESLEVFIIPLEKNCVDKSIEIMQNLHNNNLSALIANPDFSLKSNLKYCDSNKVKFAVIIGENEIKSNMFAVKNIAKMKQEKVKYSDLVNFISDNIKNQ